MEIEAEVVVAANSVRYKEDDALPVPSASVNRVKWTFETEEIIGKSAASICT